MKPPLMLNMIVRNESARIERCLKSVLPYVKAVAILDTGSTDDTKEIIKRVCEAAGVGFIIAEGPFEDFSQARNLAFRLAKDYNVSGFPFCQFALLVDADMELVVEDPKAFDGLDANALSYDMMQKGGSVSYANRRLINLSAKDNPYVGVTHEYLDLPAAGMITGARFVDHADGFNRKDKYRRDADLLNEALKTDPDNGRYLYYLGNTYRDGNNPCLAIDAYQRRITLGGWDEETHSAMMNLACSYKDHGVESKFIAGMIEAYNFRPSRAEPLYDLAKYYREKGDTASALLFAKAGANIKRPNDVLFVNDYVYSHGLRYEYAIAGYYNEAERDRAFEVTDDLALDPACPPDIRESARGNLFWFLKPLGFYCPSFLGKQIDFEPPDGYQAMNPSVVVQDGSLLCNIRCVNYKIDEHGRYMIGPQECGDAPIVTRNFIAYLNDDLSVDGADEIIWNRPPPAWDMVIGLEDIRLNVVDDQLRFSATVRETLETGQCQMVAGRIDHGFEDYQVTSWTGISDGKSCEKNWAPLIGTNKFMYKPDVVVSPLDGDWKATVNTRKLHGEALRGSSQLVEWKNGWVGIVHEAVMQNNQRVYWHRFVWYDHGGLLCRVSKPFFFYDKQIEFCAGLTLHGTNFVISFGVRDAEAHIATVDSTEVSRMLALYWTTADRESH